MRRLTSAATPKREFSKQVPRHKMNATLLPLRQGLTGLVRNVPDTVKKLLTILTAFGHSQVNAAAADGRRGVRFVAELILRDDFEVFGGGLEHKGLAAHVGGVDPIAHHDRR